MTRYAIYFVPPPESALYRFGAATIGYDCYAGADIPAAMPDFSADEWRAFTAEPRRYGFHATLKAPFGLRDEFSERELVAHFETFARGEAAPAPFPTVLRLIDGFAAIVPDNSHAPNPLADACVRAFDPFRAPMTDADRKRRLAAPLSERQIAHVDRWGYPYVFEDFRFHMTLTGRLPPARADEVLRALEAARARAAVPASLAIGTIALLRQDGGAPFRVIATAALEGARP